VLAVIAVAQLMVVLDLTIANIALPHAQADLGFDDSLRSWVVTAYALAFGGLLLLGGRLGDVVGRKWTFVGGLAGFAAASVLGGAAGTFAVLVAARALQGVFAAVLAPSALALLTTTFTDHRERGRAIGVFGAVAGAGGGVGLVLGGALTEYASWRWCFFVNVLFAAVAVVGGLVLLDGGTTHARPKIDVVGAVLASLGAFALVLGFSRAETAGWGDASTLGTLGAAVVLLVGFVLVERKVRSPLLPLRVVTDRRRGTAYLCVAVLSLAMFSVFLFLTYHLQLVLGYSPLVTGLAFLPMILTTLVLATVANTALVPRFGVRALAVVGMVLGAAGMAWLSRLTPDGAYVTHVLPALLLVGIAYALVLAPAMYTATHGIEHADAGVASAMVSTMQQVGGAIGTALLSTVAASATSSCLTAHPGAVTPASVHGWAVAFGVAAGVFVVGAVLAGLLFPAGFGRREPAVAR